MPVVPVVPVCAARHKPYERGVGDDAAGQRWIDDENAGENSDGIGLPRTRNVRDRGSTPREPSGGDTALRGLCCTAPRIDWEVLSMNTEVLDQPVVDTADDFDLDVKIVESGDVADVLLVTTDNGCNTVKTQDC